MRSPATQANPARERVRGIVPKMIELSEQVIYGDIWERPGLSKRDRNLIVVATVAPISQETMQLRSDTAATINFVRLSRRLPDQSSTVHRPILRSFHGSREEA